MTLARRYLAITLSKLDDFENACSAYEKAIEMENEYMFHLNYGAPSAGALALLFPSHA
jgi:hypothetical protein